MGMTMDKATYHRFVNTTPNPRATKNNSGDCEFPPLSDCSVDCAAAAAEVVDVAVSSAAVGTTAARARRPIVSRRTACRWEASEAIVAAVGRGATHVPDAAAGGVGEVLFCGLLWLLSSFRQAVKGNVLWRVGRLKWIGEEAQFRICRGVTLSTGESRLVMRL